MDIRTYIKKEDEQPLDTIVTNGGFCGLFRTIACIGDSLSSGEFESIDANGVKQYHDLYEYSWGQFIARDTGATVYNFSRGGMSAKHYDEMACEKGFYSPEYKANAYIIALGVNDISLVMNGDIALGDLGDIDLADHTKNKPTFVGDYTALIAKYKAIQPRAKFFLMTMPRGMDGEERDALYDRHAELLYGIAGLFENCYVLDLRKYAPVYDEEFQANFFLGGHLNPSGYRLTALMVESYIDYLIRHNPADFRQVGFIGTEHTYPDSL